MRYKINLIHQLSELIDKVEDEYLKRILIDSRQQILELKKENDLLSDQRSLYEKEIADHKNHSKDLEKKLLVKK